MTSEDRHASHDSPYRTGQHMPLPQSRHAPLTSIATSAMESRADVNSPYPQDPSDLSNGFLNSSKSPMSPHSPYLPGARSSQNRLNSEDALDKFPSAEIQMQNFADGLPPPPPVSHSWKRIDRWAEDNYEELFDQLCEGCTQNDVNELEHELDMTLPMDVRGSLQVHDGQERGGLPTGILFGCMLLDCEEIVQEWRNWRKVNEEYLSRRPNSYRAPQAPVKAFAGASSSSTPPPPEPKAGAIWQQELLSRQDSQPPNAVQKAYAHPSWIPLARDWGGNCIAVDLAPGSTGKWGQVIIFGRDYDCKYVIARSWASFLATVADDLSQSDKVVVDEETGELKLKEFKRQNIDPPYLEILRWRCDQKYGRKGPSRRPGQPLHLNTGLSGPSSQQGSASGSPYGSPVSTTTEERGRSPNRFGKGPAANSPRPHISSPLARVAEAPEPIKRLSGNLQGAPNGKAERLIALDSPRPSSEEGKRSLEKNKENAQSGDEKGKEKGTRTSVQEMKTVDL